MVALGLGQWGHVGKSLRTAWFMMDCAESIAGSSDKPGSHRMLGDAGYYWRFIWSESV